LAIRRVRLFIRGTGRPETADPWHTVAVVCIQRAFAPDDDELDEECSWASIAEAIRLRALGRPIQEAVDLNRWADLLEGIGALEPPKEP
jgi:hypothetical protein